MLNIHEKMGMLISVIISPPTSNSWEYKDLKIVREGYFFYAF